MFDYKKIRLKILAIDAVTCPFSREVCAYFYSNSQFAERMLINDASISPLRIVGTIAKFRDQFSTATAVPLQIAQL